FTARQWFSTSPPGFLWAAEVGNFPLTFRGRDLFTGDKGSMLIKIYGIIPVVNASGPKLDQGALVRYLSEIIWIPWAATSDYVTWEQINDRQAKASIRWGETAAFGIFTFDEMGRPIRFEAKRYYNRGNDATLEDWVVKVDPQSYTSFDGIMVPTSASVAWEIETGTFNWLKLDITELDIAPSEFEK
ncbi:MAG: hypothetical protein P8X57_15730, partial [Cyclobacteriaceae bacterium]